MKTFLIALSLTAVTMWAQLAIPQIGFMQDSANALRPVYGVAGNFVLGDSAAADVQAASFSGSFGMLKTGSTLIIIDRQGQAVASQDAPAGPALFAFSRTGAPALAYLPQSNVLLQWSDGVFQQVTLDPQMFASNTVLAIAAVDEGLAAFVLQRNDGLWDVQIRLSTGEVMSQTALLGMTAPVLMLATGELIYGDANGIVVRNPDGVEKHIDAQLPATFAFQQIGEGWIQVRDPASQQQCALRLTEGKEQFYILPGVDQ
jgi:hypothetical protein